MGSKKLRASVLELTKAYPSQWNFRWDCRPRWPRIALTDPVRESSQVSPRFLTHGDCEITSVFGLKLCVRGNSLHSDRQLMQSSSLLLEKKNTAVQTGSVPNIRNAVQYSPYSSSSSSSSPAHCLDVSAHSWQAGQNGEAMFPFGCENKYWHGHWGPTRSQSEGDLLGLLAGQTKFTGRFYICESNAVKPPWDAIKGGERELWQNI